MAAAAREVLVRRLPEQAALVETEYGRALMNVRGDAARTAGIATGQAAAWATMNRRQGDGADTAAQPAYVPRPGPGEYQFTAPFDFAAQPGWGRVQPFVIELREHATDGPQALSSVQYAHDLAYVKEVGHLHSKTRTPEESEIAAFWYEDSPLGWNRIANGVVRQRGLDNWQAARAFALLHFAMANGFIAGFDAKYEHRFWRPVTAIHAAATDGNPLTEADAAWQPFQVTPPVPDYPSTHTVLGWAAAEVLIDLFGDKQHFSLTSLTLPGATRHYRGFSQAARENGLSRIYAGIHFRHAVKDGRRQGRSIGQSVAEVLAPGGTVLLVEPFANDRVEVNLNPVGQLYYAGSALMCCAHAISEGGKLVLGAQAGEARLADVFRKAGFKHFRRATDTPFNLIFEARR